MQSFCDKSKLVAILGATNTGKTHLALDRMLAYSSGMIGFPLRLLARENYDRAVKVKGAGQVALITGEEKILPNRARYFLCTTEAMPTTRQVDFLAVDEIQMCGDLDRGHIFTERLLHARGRFETMFMGADTIRPIIRTLVPDVEFVERSRMSTLTYSGPKKLARLPNRTAVVAFTASDVYALAELVRRQRGGAAVIMGALSPRTRNAQIELYQSGEVDFLVATDAIGMGLNMDVDHVAFAQIRKFDGRNHRLMQAAELAQIAGRAGRHMNNGSFGTTADIGDLDEDVRQNIEHHNFPSLEKIFWRNSELDFRSIHNLRKSLAKTHPTPQLIKSRPADDELSLAGLASNVEIVKLTDSRDAVHLLWDVSRIPDFRKVASDAHISLLTEIYRHLRGPSSRLPTDWLAAQVNRLDRTGGDIDTLTQRIAGIRIWTYIAFHGAWVQDSDYWRGQTRVIEDKLSDVLHDRLVQRFVDKRTAHLVRRLKDEAKLLGAVRKDGEVLVEGHNVGRLLGFQFAADHGSGGPRSITAARAVERAVRQVLPQEIERRVTAVQTAKDMAFSLSDPRVSKTVNIVWTEAPIARLMAGRDVLHPKVKVLHSELLNSAQKKRINERLDVWIKDRIKTLFRPLFAGTKTLLSGSARGILFQLGEYLGSMPRADVLDEVAALEPKNRRALRQIGIRIGRESIFAPLTLKTHAVIMRGVLWALKNDIPFPLALPANGRASLQIQTDSVTTKLMEAIGYRALGNLAVRVEILERVASEAWSLSERGPFEKPACLMNLLGCSAEDLTNVLVRLGYKSEIKDNKILFTPISRKAGRTGPLTSRVSSRHQPAKKENNIDKSRSSARKFHERKADPNSPFSKLRELNLGNSVGS
ncbi:MAG: hypothetical protein CBB68_15265 [Rhodospirillaceae bacterium TMED8]|nr:disulfide oxidoreductase [Magnetovibrio sp.]OUT47785.1 MAG: hypothetical protein CBB68_15265 [Rhodospirillaceae bacterium TMED8]|tara:strand:+ start:913 stop:3528 length:2616 start_codon:yes stop_codon:yes gene_type:complete